MIRQALIALGLSAGAAHGQGLVPTAPILEACGGTRVVLVAEGNPDADKIEAASDVVSRRVGGLLGEVFDYTDVKQGQITLSVPSGMGLDAKDLKPLLQNARFGFYELDMILDPTDIPVLSDGQIMLPSARGTGVSYVLKAAPILDGRVIDRAAAQLDGVGRPEIRFQMDERGAEAFGEYTTNNVGRLFAIALRDEVISAPRIQAPIYGGRGVITGAFSDQEAAVVAALLQGGALPFALTIEAQETLDGSDPSADFCP